MVIYAPDDEDEDDEEAEELGLMEARMRPMDLPLCFSVLFQLWLAPRPLCVVVVQCCGKCCHLPRCPHSRISMTIGRKFSTVCMPIHGGKTDMVLRNLDLQKLLVSILS